MFNVEYDGDAATSFSVTVMSVTGSIVYSREFHGTEKLMENIDLRDAGKGIYLLIIRENDMISIIRIVFI